MGRGPWVAGRGSLAVNVFERIAILAAPKGNGRDLTVLATIEKSEMRIFEL